MHKGWLVLAGGLAVATPLLAPRMKMTPFYTLQGHNTRNGPAMTRDGKRMYYVQDSTELVMYDRTTRKESRILGGMPGRHSDVAVSVQGDRLAFCRNAEDGSGPFVYALTLNPATGLATGVPKRVSMSDGGSPSFSPDGRRIAFSANVKGTVAQKLVVVPSAGGPETVVLTANGAEDLWPIQWTPDGQTLYYGGAYERDGEYAKNGMYRVAASGGTPTLVIKTSDYGTTPGLSPDGRWLVVSDPSDDSTVVATADGNHILTYFPGEGESADFWRDASHGISSINHAPRVTTMADLATGAIHSVKDSILEAGNPAWSPDGRMVAAATRRPGGIEISNADGSGYRRLHTATAPSPGLGISWSPDGRWIAYRFGSTGAIHAYEIATGAERAMAARTSMPRIAWRSDSKALFYEVAELSATPDSVHRGTVHEASLAGGDRVLAALDFWCPTLCAVDVVSDSIVLTLNRNLEYQVRDVRHAGPPVTLLKRPTFTMAHPVPSANEQWLAIRMPDAAGNMRKIELMHLDGSARRTVTVSFDIIGGMHNPWISPDGRRLIVLGRGAGETTMTFYDVDVSSGTTKKLMPLPHPNYGRIQEGEATVSPDGRSVLFTIPAPPSVTFYDVDLSALLKPAVGGRGGNR